MRRLRLAVLLLLLLLAACRPTPPLESIVTPTAVVAIEQAATPPPSPVPSPSTQPSPSPSLTTTSTPTPVTPTIPQARPSPTPPVPPTVTLTPQPTNTAAPTNTMPPPAAAVVTIEHPLINEFVAATVAASGSVANVGGGTVLLSLRTLDGQGIGPEPAPAALTPVEGGLQFNGQLALEPPPTPRQAVLIAQYGPDVPGQTVVETGQLVNLQGRYGHIDRLVVEQPKPDERGDAPELDVRGVATGPPAKVLTRLLDPADNVVASAEAQLSWHQAGLPCDYRALLPNAPEATQLQVIALGPDDSVLEETRVRLNP